MQPITLTNASFSTIVENAKGVVLVDFWVPWCMPRHLVSPVIERLAKSFAGRATVANLNVDEHASIAARYHISGIPTVGIFRDGKLIKTWEYNDSLHVWGVLETELTAKRAEAAAQQ